MHLSYPQCKEKLPNPFKEGVPLGHTYVLFVHVALPSERLQKHSKTSTECDRLSENKPESPCVVDVLSVQCLATQFCHAGV